MGGHTSATELGEVARKANPKLLVLYHQGYRGESDADLIGRIGAGFKGRILSARDLDVY
jgi:ribonuclease BN (tRNA processing enzyme)